MAPKKIAQTVLTEGKFYTISAANGKVIEVADYNIDNGAKIQLMDNANFEWQQWNFVAAGDGVYRIQNRFTGKMMDLDMGGVSDGTRVHQWEGAQASSQLWVVEPTNDGHVKIKSNLAGKLLDRLPAILSGDYGIEFSPLAIQYFSAFEEGTEPINPLIFAASVWISQTGRRYLS